MYTEMTDEQAIFGPHRATECEWTHPKPCLAPVVPTKAYCEAHMKEAYQPPKRKVKKSKYE